MNSTEFIERVLILNPKAKCVAWEVKDNKDYFGENVPLDRFNLKIDWSKLNETSCPSEEMLLSITEEQLAMYREQKQNNALLAQYKDDLTMRALFEFKKSFNPNLTFIQFLNNLSNTEV